MGGETITRGLHVGGLHVKALSDVALDFLEELLVCEDVPDAVVRKDENLPGPVDRDLQHVGERGDDLLLQFAVGLLLVDEVADGVSPVEVFVDAAVSGGATAAGNAVALALEAWLVVVAERDDLVAIVWNAPRVAGVPAVDCVVGDERDNGGATYPVCHKRRRLFGSPEEVLGLRVDLLELTCVNGARVGPS